MSGAWRVADDMWLGLARSPFEPAVSPSRRRVLDQEAAASAEWAALTASGLGADGYAVSRSHTRGTGAAVVAPEEAELGVDLVPIDRVGERHAAGIVTPAEWAALERYAAIRPALAWALKEAAAKATGEPLRHFPDLLRIELESCSLVVRVVAEPEVCFVADWVRYGQLLCAWVRAHR